MSSKSKHTNSKPINNTAINSSNMNTSKNKVVFKRQGNDPVANNNNKSTATKINQAKGNANASSSTNNRSKQLQQSSKSSSNNNVASNHISKPQKHKKPAALVDNNDTDESISAWNPIEIDVNVLAATEDKNLSGLISLDELPASNYKKLMKFNPKQLYESSDDDNNNNTNEMNDENQEEESNENNEDIDINDINDDDNDVDDHDSNDDNSETDSGNEREFDDNELQDDKHDQLDETEAAQAILQQLTKSKPEKKANTDNKSSDKSQSKAQAQLQSDIKKTNKRKALSEPTIDDNNNAIDDDSNNDNNDSNSNIAKPKDIVEPSLDEIPASEWDQFNLHPIIRKALHVLKFSNPTPIQSACLPLAITNYKDIIAASKTGTGKTLAFGIPIIHRLLQLRDMNKLNKSALSTLILTPTRELAIQIVNHIQSLTMFTNKSTPINIVSIVGGMSEQKQLRQLNNKPLIIVCTPGRLWELISNQQHPHLTNLNELRFLVLDEADRMIATGHYPELNKILQFVQKPNSDNNDNHNEDGKDQNSINKSSSIVWEVDPIEQQQDNNEEEMSDNDNKSKTKVKNKGNGDNNETNNSNDKKLKKSKSSHNKTQIFLFSATLMLSDQGRVDINKKKSKYNSKFLNSEHQSMLLQLQSKLNFQSEPAIIDLSNNTNNLLATGLTEYQIQCTTQDKDYYLYYFLYFNPGRTLIFVNSISCLRRLISLLTILKLKVYGLHAEMQQKQRLKNLERFKANDNSIIICTDVAARGLDIPKVPFVIQYQLSRTSEIYIHRAGRTARANTNGTNLSLVDEKDIKNYNQLCKVLNKSNIDNYPIDNSYMIEIRNRTHIAREIDLINNYNKKNKSKKDWLLKNAQAIDIIVDDIDNLSDTNDNDNNELNEQNKIKLRKLTMQLNQLLQHNISNNRVKKNFFTLNYQLPASSQTLTQLNELKQQKTNPTATNIDNNNVTHNNKSSTQIKPIISDEADDDEDEEIGNDNDRDDNDALNNQSDEDNGGDSPIELKANNNQSNKTSNNSTSSSNANSKKEKKRAKRLSALKKKKLAKQQQLNQQRKLQKQQQNTSQPNNNNTNNKNNDSKHTTQSKTKKQKLK